VGRPDGRGRGRHGQGDERRGRGGDGGHRRGPRPERVRRGRARGPSWRRRARKRPTGGPGRKRVFARDYRVVCGMKSVEVMLEATGVPEVGPAPPAFRRRRAASRHDERRDDITVGPLLKWYAERKASFTPRGRRRTRGLQGTLRFRGRPGFTVVARARARTIRSTGTRSRPTNTGQGVGAPGPEPNMLIEFVDGSKTMIEMAAVSNATGLVPDVRACTGRRPRATS